MTPGEIGDFSAAVAEFGSLVAALYVLEAMKSENTDRENRGLAIAYTEAAFMKVFEQHGLGKYTP